MIEKYKISEKNIVNHKNSQYRKTIINHITRYKVSIYVEQKI